MDNPLVFLTLVIFVFLMSPGVILGVIEAFRPKTTASSAAEHPEAQSGF